MKEKIVGFAVVVISVIAITRLGMQSRRVAVEAWGQEFPVEGLVVPDHAPHEFHDYRKERLPTT
jgi:hypothetical protein